MQRKKKGELCGLIKQTEIVRVSKLRQNFVQELSEPVWNDLVKFMKRLMPPKSKKEKTGIIMILLDGLYVYLFKFPFSL